MHAVHGDLESGVGERGAGEHRVDGLDRLALLALAGGQHRLGHQLPAEDDVVAEVDVGGPVVLGSVGLEGQRLEERIDGGHDVFFSLSSSLLFTSLPLPSGTRLSALLGPGHRRVPGPYATSRSGCDPGVVTSRALAAWCWPADSRATLAATARCPLFPSGPPKEFRNTSAGDADRRPTVLPRDDGAVLGAPRSAATSCGPSGATPMDSTRPTGAAVPNWGGPRCWWARNTAVGRSAARNSKT